MPVVIAAFCCLLLAGVWAAQTPPPKPSLCAVSGQVVQEPGGMSLRKVLVSLASAGEGISMDGGRKQPSPEFVRQHDALGQSIAEIGERE